MMEGGIGAKFASILEIAELDFFYKKGYQNIEVEASKYFSCTKYMYLAFCHLICQKFGKVLASGGTCLLAPPNNYFC